ncbi:MAG: chromosome segregation protein SMC [Fibromonadaceae bacterium]|nr:chromosome segregation protein SMC [Fibromonadaceae bacterium]
MRIQKLIIHGFKSFAQKTEIPFDGNGLTGIVGPNGCGKSNIVDALRWVMGEQRTGLLRMDKMQGVIFSGTEERPAMSMAEVSLVIDNDRELFPSEYSEVMITRRAFNNGESEYLINNQECRLADIRGNFADTGMGAGSYSQMDQRMVDALLSDKAEERRTIFEEAAGVSKYKKQRKEAAAQIEKVQANMEHIDRELQHAKREFRQQERMLARADELRKLKSRLKEVDVSINIGRYNEDKAALHALSAAKKKGEHELETLKTRLTELETKIEEKQLLISSDAETLNECEREFSAVTAEVAKLNEAYKHLKNRDNELEESSNRCEREIESGSNNLLALKNEMQSLENELKNIAPDAQNINAKSMLEDLRIKHRELLKKRLESVQEEGKLKSAWQRTDAEMEMLGERISGTSKEIQSIDFQIEELERAQKNKEGEISENKSKSEILQERQSILSNEREELSENLESLASQKIECLSSITRLESRLEALQSISENLSGLDGNKWILNQKASEGAVLLSGQIEVLESKHVAVVEFCLGSFVQAVLMQNKNSVLECTQTLNGENLGRALLAWNTNLFEELKLDEPNALPLGSLAKCNGNSGSLVKCLLSKYFLVNDFETAARLAEKYAGKDLWFCTEDCQAISASGLAKIGKEQKESRGILQQNADIKSLKESLEEERKKSDSTNSKIAGLKEKAKEIDILIANAAEEKQIADSHIRAADSDLKIANAKKYALAEQREKHSASISNFENRLQELKEFKDSNAELSTATAELEQAEREFERIDGQLRELERVFNRLLSIEGQIQTLNNSIVLRSEELEAIKSRKGSLESEIEDKATQIENQHSLLEKKETLRDTAREKYNAMAGDVEKWRAELRDTNSSLREKEKASHEQALVMQASDASLERTRERIFQEYEFDLEKEPSEQNFSSVSIEERDALFEIRELQEKIKAIGPVNASIAEDFETERKRVLDIEAQYNDLAEAKNSLSTAIERLDTVARDRFLGTFRKIQKNYQEVFASLMPGGEALLYMQGDLDPLEAEIEINARPTGKKMRGVRALSGGERALTATSLLFALYMVKPSPYCILDEIDGPLDDANIGRFVALLRRFSQQTQFVVITHNKRTMEGCDMLYGVSQEISGVSKVGSVRLEGAEAYSA